MIESNRGLKSPKKELKVQVRAVNDIESNPGPKSPKKELKVQVRAVNDRVQPRAQEPQEKL